MESKRWQATQAESGVRLLQFLRTKLGPEYSSRILKQALENNACEVNGRIEHFGSTLVGWGDKISFLAPRLSPKAPTHRSEAKGPPSTLFEDDDFLIVDKPPGIRSEDVPLLRSLKAQDSREHLELAHRLDKETSGALILVKSPRAKEAMFRLFKERQVEKTYLAIVEGHPRQAEGRIHNFLGKISAYQGQNIWGVVDQEKGARAITTWILKRKGKKNALLECSPLTGRTHQIRVHLAGIGHPILGDSLYSKSVRSEYWAKRCLLHAFRLNFVHPFSLATLAIEAPIPSDFTQALNHL